jgi:hypothetical protein
VRFDLDFESSLEGDGSETVSIVWMDANLFKDKAGNGLLSAPMTEALSEYKYINKALEEKL